MTDWRIPLFNLDIGEAEIAAVEAVLRSQWLTMGDRIREFETAFADRHDVPHAFAVANCTAGLHLAYVAAGVQPGDEVIVPSLTFVATANTVIAAGATPVFADVVGPADLGLSPAAVEAAITPRTRAIATVHYAGYATDLTALRAIADRHGVALIEDCAHAPGAQHAGRPVGSWGDVGCFSFFSNKNLATGEGGMVTTQRADIAAKLKLLRSHGMTTLTLDRHRGHAFTYDVVAAGYNYRMDEMHAALGGVQLGKLEGKNAQRRVLTAAYREQLATIPGVEVPYRHHDLADSSCHIMPVLLPEGTDREAVMKHMAAERIQTSIHYPPVHQFEYYAAAYPNVRLPVTEALAPRLITLPLFPAMTVEQVGQVCLALESAIDTKTNALLNTRN
jgi:dTDP-4-amino-4,6-dideoxygalactose transaminase